MKRDFPKSVVPLEDGGRIVRTNCFECHSKCGVRVHVSRSEEVVKITGNPEDPRTRGTICSKAQAGRKILYSPERVNYPLRRTGERGEGRWERITWDEAMDVITTRILEYKRQYGPESIVLSQGTGRGTNQWCQRLGKSIGMNHWCLPAHMCLLPAMMTSMITYGFFPIWDGNDYENARCIVLWGGNPTWSEGATSSAPIEMGRKNGAKLIVIDPHFEHPLAHKADYWLPVQPGTDGALAMAWLNVLIGENLYDREFVEKWTNASHLVDAKTLAPVVESMIREGGDRNRFVVWDSRSGRPVAARSDGAEPAMEGSFDIVTATGEARTVTTAWSVLLERIAEYPPRRAAEITGVGENLIRESARLYGESSPGSCVNFMQGLEEHVNNTSAMRGILCLMAIAGNLDVKGGNIFIPFWNEMLGPRLTGEDPPAQRTKKLGNSSLYPVSQASHVWKAILTEDPYPIKAFLVFAGNPLAWCEDPKLVERALRKVEFLVVHEYFMSATAELADIVLPAANWLERDYIADELTGRYYFAQQRAIDPLFERKSNITLFRELGKRVAPDWWPWESDEAMFDFQLETCNTNWKELLDKWVYKYAPEVYRFYEKRGGFETPSGLVELYSNVLFSVGSDPLPTYVPAVEPTAEHPFIMMTGRRYPNFYHSTFQNVSWLRSLEPHPKVDINPESAEKLGIADGDLVWIESTSGKIQMFARLTNGIHPRNLSATHGWQQGCRELKLPGYPNHISNVNALVNNEVTSPEFATPNLRCLPVKIYKAVKSEIPGFPYVNLNEVPS